MIPLSWTVKGAMAVHFKGICWLAWKSCHRQVCNQASCPSLLENNGDSCSSGAKEFPEQGVCAGNPLETGGMDTQIDQGELAKSAGGHAAIVCL